MKTPWHRVGRIAGLAVVELVAAACVEGGSGAPAAPGGASDQEVIEHVLLDLASYTGKDSPVVVRGAVAVPLLVSAGWLASPVTVKDVLYRHDAKPWTSLTEDDERALAEAAADLAARATREAGRIRFSSSDPRVRLAEPTPAPPGPDPFGRSRSIRLWPPGRSADGRLAVVRLSIPWSIHEAVGTYVVARRDGSWTILVRQFVYYP